ncbi:hypothetical protein PFAG_04129 [Plasmodium falciparum Santa Lucia]|uniref:Kinesin-like protein n=1 Tax=Plasmodium falciparum Santa Lucia TaxID=478859 RepID=W7FLE0_PLAFA|nr:hypothetical protein PFAG_04129 [Plasmodium falciparum Santa Lucia]
MVNKNVKGYNPNQNRGTSKGRNISKNNKIIKNKEGGKNLYTWYIDNKIDEKKKKNEDIENNKAKYFEDVAINKNVEEYINVICRIKNNKIDINNKIDTNNKLDTNNNINNNNVDVIKKISYNKLVIDTFHVGNKSSLNFEYTYDRVYDIENNNHMIFNDYIKNNIKNIFQGINCSILAYGQTNSGKTYTMLGNFDFLNNLFHLCKDYNTCHNNENKINKVHDKINHKDNNDNNKDATHNNNNIIKTNINMNNSDQHNDIHLTYDELTNCITNEPNNVGIIPHCINYIFNYINYHKQQDKINDKIKEFTVTLSILEIYNEVIYDLISGESNLSVHMIDSNKNEFIIKNLKEVEIENIISALYYLEQGVNNRKIAFTHMNKASSRSHLIFIIKINRYIYSTNTIRCGKLCLVDLAGSERLKQTKATGSIKIETTMINKSLTVLSKVINSLAIMQIKEKIEKNIKEKEKEKNKDNDKDDDKGNDKGNDKEKKSII